MPLHFGVKYFSFPDTAPSDENFTISVIVTKTGFTSGSCEVPLTITDVNYENNTSVHIKNVMLESGETKEVTFDSINLPEGDYLIEVQYLSYFPHVD